MWREKRACADWLNLPVHARLCDHVLLLRQIARVGGGVSNQRASERKCSVNTHCRVVEKTRKVAEENKVYVNKSVRSLFSHATRELSAPTLLCVGGVTQDCADC